MRKEITDIFDCDYLTEKFLNYFEFSKYLDGEINEIRCTDYGTKGKFFEIEIPFKVLDVLEKKSNDFLIGYKNKDCIVYVKNYGFSEFENCYHRLFDENEINEILDRENGN